MLTSAWALAAEGPKPPEPQKPTVEELQAKVAELEASLNWYRQHDQLMQAKNQNLLQGCQVELQLQQTESKRPVDKPQQPLMSPTASK